MFNFSILNVLLKVAQVSPLSPIYIYILYNANSGYKLIIYIYITISYHDILLTYIIRKI